MLKCPECLSDKLIRKSYSSSGKQRYKCKSCGHRSVNPIGLDHLDQSIDQAAVASKMKKVKKKRRWVVTSAQNATPPRKEWLDTLHQYCDYHNAELIVIPFRYRNPTSVFTDEDYDWWHESLEPHLVDKRYELCKGLILLGDIQIQPTAVNPLTGLDGFTGAKSGLVGHPQYQFKTVATRQGEMPKIMSTTGCVTVDNYTKSKAGKRGAHNHQYAATVVESDGDLFHMRQITADGQGNCIDLDSKFTPTGVQPAPRPASIVLGDLHQWWVADEVDEATFGKNGLIELLNPENVYIHDAMDSFSVSHHHRNDPFIKWAKHHYKKSNVKQELIDLCDYMAARISDERNYHFVPSNHDDHITRYIKETDWRQDPENAEFYLETASYMLKSTVLCKGGTSTVRPFDYWVNQFLPDVNIINRDTSSELLGVEHAMHGDQGSNGSRGSAQSISKIGVKSTVGHSHSPSAINGCYQVGVMAPDMTYASGPSSWLSSHVVLYADGNRTHVHIIAGRFKSWR